MNAAERELLSAGPEVKKWETWHWDFYFKAERDYFLVVG